MENTITLNSGQKIEVLLQDEVSLDIDCSLRYIKSGQKEISDYVETTAKPQLDEVITEAETDIAAQIAKGVTDAAKAAALAADSTIASLTDEAENKINQFVTDTITPALTNAVAEAAASAGAAESAAVSANATALSVATDAGNSKIWAEGTDDQVAGLGGIHSSKGWAEAMNLDKLVTTDTVQTIAASKTFTGNVFTNIDAVDISQAPTADAGAKIGFKDKNGEISGFLENWHFKDGAKRTSIRAFSKITGNLVGGDVAAGVYSNGTPYATAPTPQASNLTTANNIATTGWCSDSAKSTNIVHRSDTEVITGSKIFTNSPYNIQIKNNEMENGVTPTSNKYCGINFMDKNNVRTGWIGITQTTDGRQLLDLQKQGATSGVVFPSPADNAKGNEGVTASWVNKKLSSVASVPNYSAGVSVASGFTAAYNGFLKVYISSNYPTINITVNGVQVVYFRFEHHYTDQVTYLIPIAKGDVVDWASSSAGGLAATFFPMKGA